MPSSSPTTACNDASYNTQPNAQKPPRKDYIVILGIGNVLWADEGFGVRCVEALHRDYEFSPHVELVDGGTQGLYLIQNVQSATHLLIFDAIDYDLAPGTIKLIEDDDVPRFMGAKKMSLHQTGFQEVLSLAQLTGDYPQRVLLIGCQPEELEDYGGSLRPSVREKLPEALRIAVDRLTAWGANPKLRDVPLPAYQTLTGAMLTLDRYEMERPDESTACRTGDDRFIPTES